MDYWAFQISRFEDLEGLKFENSKLKKVEIYLKNQV
jgi:hypothetical protein